MSDMFDGPGSASGVVWKDIEGALLLIKPISTEDGIKTAYGEASAVRADVIILDGPQKGEMYADALVFPRALQAQIKGNAGTGRYNLGRLGTGAAKPGQSAPWLLGDPSDADKDVARAWISANAGPGF